MAGELYNDAGNLLHRTLEWEASVWRKTNGTHKSWFEQVYQLPPGHYGPESRRQVPPPTLVLLPFGGLGFSLV